MSHAMGVMCATCCAVLEPDDCPECKTRFGPGHGFTFQTPNDWAAKTWPDHPCFTEPTTTEKENH